MSWKLTYEAFEKKVKALEKESIRRKNTKKTSAEIEKNSNDIFQKEKLQNINEMVRTLCHDLNQRMQGIVGYTDLLFANILDDNPQVEYIEPIEDQIDKAAEITKKIMDITKYIN